MSDNSVNNYQFQPSLNWSAGSTNALDVAGQAGTAAAKSANPEKLALAFLAKMSEVGAGQYGAAHGVKGTTGAQGVQTTQAGVRFTGQTFTATMPPPAAPRVQFNAQTQGNFQSFAQESKAAMQNVGTWTQGQQILQQQGANTKQLLNASSNTMDEVANDTAGWLTNASMGAGAMANGGLAAFMKLRIENTDKAINSLQDLAGTTQDMQSVMAEQQAAAAKAAQEEAQKSQKKSGIMGIFQKVFAVVLAIVCTVVAVCTCDPAIAALGVVAAAMAFGIAGAVKGAKEGKGFDAWGGLDWYTNVIGMAGFAAIFKSAAKAATTIAVKALTETVETAGKEGAEVAAGAAAKSAAQTGSSEAGDAAADSAKGAATAAAQEGAEGGAGAGAKTLTAEEVAEMQKKSLDKGFKKLFKEFRTQVKADLMAQTGSTSMKEFGTKLGATAAVTGSMEVGDQVGTAIMQKNVSMYQANADEDMAHFTQLQSMVKMLDTTYKTANDLVQALVKSHSSAVDTVQTMLKSNNDVQNMIATNMSQI